MYKLANFVWSHTNVFSAQCFWQMFLYFYSVPMCKNTDSWLWISVCVFMHISICISAGCYCICLCTYEYVYIYITIIFTYAVFVSVPLSFFFLIGPHFFHGSAPRRMTETQADWDGKLGNCLVWLQLTFRWCENWDTLWCSSFFVLVINAVLNSIGGARDIIFCRVVQCSG